MGGIVSKHTQDSRDNVQISSTSSSQTVQDVTNKDFISELPDTVIGHISKFLTPQEESRLRISIPAMRHAEREALRARGISPALTTFFAPPQRTANYLVLTGRPEFLLEILQKDPNTFFKKYEQSIDAAGQMFFNVSPADLIYFLCDDDMQMQIKDFAQHLPEEQREIFFEKWQMHHDSRGRGGADLVMVGGEYPPQYANIKNVTNTLNLLGTTKPFKRELLKNPDGVICWMAPDNQLHWYYGVHDRQTLEPIDIPLALQTAHQADYEVFIACMTCMEPYSARRSSVVSI